MIWTLRGDRGAGTIVALGVVAFVLGLATLLAPVVGIVAIRHRVATAADASALAAAAVVAGLAAPPGDGPCAAAGAIAARHDTELDACVVDGFVVTVRIAAGSAFGPVRAAATAGPPPDAGPSHDE